MKTNILIFILPFFCIFYACNQVVPEEEIICNTMFTFLTIEVQGAKLDTFYTVRQSNKDTIPDNFMGGQEGHYTLISDRYLEQLRNNQDTFHFVGIVNDSVVVREPYVVGADACHIYFVSGKKVVTL